MTTSNEHNNAPAVPQGWVEQMLTTHDMSLMPVGLKRLKKLGM